MECTFHEAANIFPIDDEHIDDLAKDIRENKQQVPIELMDGKIIDGRRRYMACRIAGVDPQFKNVKVVDPIAYVLSLNLHRRHLSPTQLAMVGARARDIYDAAAKERQKDHGKTSPGKTKENTSGKFTGSDARDAVGKTVGVSGKSIDHATAVLKKGTPELIAAVDADRISVSTAARASSFSEEEQVALAKRAQEAAENGHRKRPRATENDGPDEDEGGTIERKGVGVMRANEAINILSRIPKNDGLRKRGFQVVTDWIRKNK